MKWTAPPDARCFVESSYWRSLLVFLVLPLILLAVHLQWVTLGDWPLFNFYHFLSPNDVPLWKVAVGIAAIVIGAVRYGPHAFKTLLNGTRVCAADGTALYLYGESIPAPDLRAVHSVRGLFRKGLIFELLNGSERYVCTIFNRQPNPENIADRLRKHLKAQVN